MIVLFQGVIFLLYKYFTNITTTKKDVIPTFEISFDPPAFEQRYNKAFNTIIDPRWRKGIKKMVDFGCAEGKFMQCFKQLINLEEIICVDIRKELLFKIKTSLKYSSFRPLLKPLQIKLFIGSVSDSDYGLKDVDAVTAIELIEHVYPDVLDAIPYNIFGYIHPKIVIITTPNADFNVLFRSSNKFRNDDHKFEWTRSEFQEWALNITDRFPDYTVEFCGIAEGPKDTEKFGCCSQMALFVRKDVLSSTYTHIRNNSKCSCSIDSKCKSSDQTSKMLCCCLCTECCPTFSYGVCTYFSYSKDFQTFKEKDIANNEYYECIADVRLEEKYKNNNSEEENILQLFGNNLQFNVPSEMPLWELLYRCNIPITEEECRDLLHKFGYKTEECETYTEEKEFFISRSVMEKLSKNRKRLTSSDLENEDWDEPTSNEVCENTTKSEDKSRI